MPAEVENILDLEAIRDSLKLITESMPLGLLKTCTKVVTLVLLRKHGCLPKFVKLPKACRKISKLDENLEKLLIISSVMKITTAQRDKIAVRNGKKDFLEFVKVLIEHVRETEVDLYYIFCKREDYPTFDYQAHNEDEIFE